MKRDPHILMSESALKEGMTYSALCGKIIPNAAWVQTDGDLRMMVDWLNALNRTCKKCKAEFYRRNDNLDVFKVYFAVDGELMKSMSDSQWPE